MRLCVGTQASLRCDDGLQSGSRLSNEQFRYVHIRLALYHTYLLIRILRVTVEYPVQTWSVSFLEPDPKHVCSLEHFSADEKVTIARMDAQCD
jgi:hypothetical protein